MTGLLIHFMSVYMIHMLKHLNVRIGGLKYLCL